MTKKKPDFLMVVMLIFGLGVLSTGFAGVAQSVSEVPAVEQVSTAMDTDQAAR
ncbi:hypothetical protein MIB92_08465 [Aestuariirhabdus sp. Z084]|uniref:hypothetical protein n=1 Tax=Aestuariirhabdus haliotis TaxID=2918751 RepID=UPI00201B3F7A|nr:hypothetical protein [Aestuariirhabdus haliotis]MCL6415682.1 hypothetical protein [Aestuariirhabdus haliotis]MCL6419792.1 hypothetical protein [Aestuariirhabdus haliotis]